MEAVYVVIGGGIAGVSCIEALSLLLSHEEGEAPSIILISATPLVKAVTRVCPLTKMLAEFSVEEKSSDYISSSYPSVRVVVDSAVKIDQHRSTVYTAGRLAIGYRKLCLCTGASPRLIEAGDRHQRVLGIRDTDSAKQLEEKLTHARRILVVGNGGIATELVHEVKGVEVVWAVKDKHISAAFVDAGAAEFFRDRLRENEGEKDAGASTAATTMVKTVRYAIDDESKTVEGSRHGCGGAALGPNWHDRINLVVAATADRPASKVSVEYEVEVRRLVYDDDGEWPVRVELTNGKTIGCDFVVSATGVTPNSDLILVEGGGEALALAQDKGIRVNERMETNLANIYAAGDVCTASWTPARHWFQMRLWTQARQMGAYAARCMAESVLGGEPTVMDFCFEMFTHVTRFFGYKVVVLGLFNAQTLDRNHELLLRVTPKNEFVKLVISDGKVQGAVLIGETDLEEMCENLILNQLDVSEFGEDLLNPDIDIEDYFD